MWEKIISNFDKYSREARLFPAALDCLPLYILVISFTDLFPEVNTYLKLFFGLALSSIFAYLASDLVRNVGKALEEKVFGNEMSFPTTELLLHSNDRFSNEKKKKVYEKIKKDFNITLSTTHQESTDIKEARKKIKEAIGVIRQRLGDGRLLLKYNIRYGFWRNLCAVAPFAFGASIAVFLVLITVVHSPTYAILSLIIAPFYLFLWIKSENVLKYFGYQYAEQFYLEYLSSK